MTMAVAPGGRKTSVVPIPAKGLTQLRITLPPFHCSFSHRDIHIKRLQPPEHCQTNYTLILHCRMYYEGMGRELASTWCDEDAG